jgi:RNA polymerase sigma factor (sigma-70 family)
MSVVKLFLSRKDPKDRFELLVRPHIESLYRLAYLLCRSQSDAEEIVQLLLTKLFQKTGQLEKIDKLKPWLSRALYNLYVDSFRTNKRNMALFTDDSENGEIATSDPSPAAVTDNRLKQSIIKKALQSLNQDQQIVVLLHDTEGYTLHELENILQTPLGTLKSRLNRARSHLRTILPMELSGDDKRVKTTR